MAIPGSLRVKGILAVLVLIGYLAFIAVVLSEARVELVRIVEQIETNQKQQRRVEPVVKALGYSIIETQTMLNSAQGLQLQPVAYPDLGMHLDMIEGALKNLRSLYPSIDEGVAGFARAVASVKSLPARHHLAQVRDREQELVVKLQDVVNGLQSDNSVLVEQYRRTQQFISYFAVTANVVGAVASVAVILVFFTRLANDIKRLQHRASAIVAGYDGKPLANRRRDEVGGLIEAVNRMQVDLRRWERQQELSRQQRFHQEKMAAVGSLASAVGHEVSNPIAAITGVAQFIVDETRDTGDAKNRRMNEFGAQILTQTERIAHLMRQLSTLTAPRSPEPELLDLNRLVQSTCAFVRFDKRFRGIEFEEDLARDLPAVTTVADHVTQILMNLLLNAADATEHLVEPARRWIRVTTSPVGDEVQLTVTDNGRGMSPEVLARAFDESFTTKPAGRGRGIGLFVCKSLVEENGGRIRLASVPDEGTTAALYLPLRAAQPATA